MIAVIYILVPQSVIAIPISSTEERTEDPGGKRMMEEQGPLYLFCF